MQINKLRFSFNDYYRCECISKKNEIVWRKGREWIIYL